MRGEAPLDLIDELAPQARAPASGAGLRWAALGDAGNAVAALAGFPPEASSREVRNLPAQLVLCEEWQRDLAERGIDDLTAVMEAGLKALMAIRARGGDCRPAALALWREFAAARAAVLALAPPSGALGPLRRA